MNKTSSYYSTSLLPQSNKDEVPKKKSMILKPALLLSGMAVIAGCAGAAMYSGQEVNKDTPGTKETNLSQFEENTHEDDSEKKVDTTQTPKDKTQDDIQDNESFVNLSTVSEKMHEAPTQEAKDEDYHFLKDTIEATNDTSQLHTYTDSTVALGRYGWWRSVKMRPDTKFFACGASVRIQPPQKWGVDDTALNGVELKYCSKDDWDAQIVQMQHEGDLGVWTSMKMCSQEKHIYSMNARVEGWRGIGDDTQMNGLMIACQRPDGSDREIKMLHPGYWGVWEGWSPIKKNQFVCGTQTRYEDYKKGKDNTNYTGLKLRLCEW